MATLDLRTIIKRTEEIATEVARVEAKAVDREARWPAASLGAMQKAGLAGLVVSEECGGLEQGLFGLARVCEVLSQECASTSLCFGMHCVASAVIGAKATADQKERFLAPIAQGKHLTTLALSEPGTGSHFYYPQTKLAEGHAGTLRLSGVKSFVTNGGFADSYVVSTASADPLSPPGEFSCVVVPERTQGVVWGPLWDGMGMRGNSSRTVELRDVEIPRNNLLGREGDQIWYVFNVVAPYFLIAMAGTYLGIANSAFGEARAHLSSRRYAHSSSSLSEVSVLQHRLGKLWSAIERTRQLVYYAAMQADQGGADALPAICSAKAEAADCVVSVVNEALTLTGGIAYNSQSVLERHLRDARASHVMAPTTDILRVWTGRSLLDLPLLVE
jgi:alkylation response protein AidB-like acyl-CoA dehydrogenase